MPNNLWRLEMIKIIFLIFGILDSLVLYCCLILGKREDEIIERMNHEKEKNAIGKEEI